MENTARCIGSCVSERLTRDDQTNYIALRTWTMYGFAHKQILRNSQKLLMLSFTIRHLRQATLNSSEPYEEKRYHCLNKIQIFGPGSSEDRDPKSLPLLGPYGHYDADLTIRFQDSGSTKYLQTVRMGQTGSQHGFVKPD
jgi:hypothetical protein